MYKVYLKGNIGIINIDEAEKKVAIPSMSEDTLATADF